MLSPNSTLQNDRYRVLRSVWETPANCLYEAFDTQFARKVLLFESFAGSNEEFDRLRSITPHPFVCVRDTFEHSGSRLASTQPVSGRLVSEMAGAPARSFRTDRVVNGIIAILQALSKTSRADSTVRYFGTGPQSVLVSDNGSLEYLYFGRSGFGTNFPKGRQHAELAFAFMPLEAIWAELDHASQKAISNSYDDPSVESLESAPDIRTDIATLGSIAYFLSTGVVPHGALERSIEMLDGKTDPLSPPHLLNPAVSPEISAALLRSMQLKRHDRYQSLDALLHDLEEARPKAAVQLDDPIDADDPDLLEIPVFAAAAASGSRTVVAPTIPEAPTSVVPSPAPANSVSPEIGRPFHSFDSDPETVEKVTAKAENVSTHSFAEDESPIFAAAAQPRGWYFHPAVIAAVLLVVVGVGGWLAVSSLSTTSSAAGQGVDAKTVIISPPAAQAPRPAETVVEQPVDPGPQTISDTPGPATQSSDPSQHTTVSAAKPRVVPAEPRMRTEPKPAPAESAPKAKKKVTVDDLISDN